jgi:sugar O-acyltransferase (sialic acid O-acetyltransferase NeuD family)
MKQIAIYGAGGFGREVAWLVQCCSGEKSNETYETVCFIDDNEAIQGLVLNDIPILSLEKTRQAFPTASVVAAIGSPGARQLLMKKATAAGFGSETIIHPDVYRSKWIEIGNGTVICAGNILTTNITLGMYVQINADCTVGHDVIMGDYATLAPGVHVSGMVHIGRRAYIGTGAVIINGTPETPIVIGEDAIVGAGACVTRSVPAATTVVGIPAKPIR